MWIPHIIQEGRSSIYTTYRIYRMNNTVKGILYVVGAVITGIVIKMGVTGYNIMNGDTYSDEIAKFTAETKARRAAIQVQKTVYDAAIAAGKNESIAKQEKNNAYDAAYTSAYNEALADEMAKINAAKRAKKEIGLARTSAYTSAIAEGKSEKNATAIGEKAYQAAYQSAYQAAYQAAYKDEKEKSGIVGGRRITRRTRHKKNGSRKGR